MSFIPNLTYSIASTVWSGTASALGKGHPAKGTTTSTTVTGPGSHHHHHHSGHSHHHHSHSHSHSPHSSSASNGNGNNSSNSANSRRYSHGRRPSSTNYNFSRSHPNGPSHSSSSSSSSSSPMTPPHSPNHYSHTGSHNGSTAERRSTRKRNPSISSMPRTPPSSPQLDSSSSFETHPTAAPRDFSRKRYTAESGGPGVGNGPASRPVSSSGYGRYGAQAAAAGGGSRRNNNSNTASSTKQKDAAPKVPTTAEERHRVVDDILETENLYRVLAVSRSATGEEIRRAYIAKSRVCHPDKFPEYPRATEAFQKLSLAYETLSKPSSRFVYDSTGGSSGKSMLGSDETLQSVLSQVFFEFMDGDFEVIRNMISRFTFASCVCSYCTAHVSTWFELRAQ
ncbi:unnamed protein product [Mortierella alpina]